MNTPKSIIHTVLAGTVFFGAAGQVSAERVFPPTHLAPNASFASGTTSERAIEDAWYQREAAPQRESLLANEIQEVSPHPSMYYFMNIRNHANDERANVEAYRTEQVNVDVRVAEEAVIDADNLL